MQATTTSGRSHTKYSIIFHRLSKNTARSNNNKRLLVMSAESRNKKAGLAEASALVTSFKGTPRLTRSSFPPANKMALQSILVLMSSLIVALSIIILSASKTTTATTTTANTTQDVSKRTWTAQDHQAGQLQAFNYLLFRPSSSQQPEDSKLEELLKDSNHSHVSDAVNIQLANSVWQKMRINALEFARQRAHEVRPTINRLLGQANVSEACGQSLNDLMDHLANLDTWAVQMYNAFGDFPSTGLFEGSLTSMGSYHQCVNVEPNQFVGKAQYCTFKFQPIVPKRPKFHNILAGIENLANFTSSNDMFHQLAKKAQYFYYLKLRLATCMPSKCEQSDFELLGKQIAVNTYLQYSGVTCLQKEEGFNPDGAQLFAIIILISMASVSFLGTLIHLFDLRSLLQPRSGLKGNGSKSKGGHFSSNQAVVVAQQQQTLLATSPQKSPMLAPTVTVQTSLGSINDSHSGSQQLHKQQQVATETTTRLAPKSFRAKLLSTMDVLVNFSIIKNGRKLFRTSSSRSRVAAAGPTSRNGSIAPSLLGEPSPVDDSSTNGNATIGVSNGAGGIAGGAGSEFESSSLNGPAPSSSSSTTSSSPNTHSDISCVHGMRFWTISWIIFGHTMQYTEWAGFARAYQVEQNIVSFLLQPFLNATFSVDTFFLISGLLTTYVTWSLTRGQYKRLNKFAFLISRYLRLTPQVLLVTLIFIVFPMMGDGPYWRGLIQKESDNCKSNWWVSALYLQAFMKQDHICNLVTWWLSIEMFYHFISIFVIVALLHSTRRGLLTAGLLGGSLTAVSCYLHFVNHYPPNMLPTLLQRYEIWDLIVLKYFWTPFPHAPSYFVGLLLGYVLYNRTISELSRAQVRYGWFAFAFCYATILFGTYSWNNNAPYSRLSSTAYYNLSQVFWSLSNAWAILACSLGHGGWLNRFLSSPIFVPLGRATYMTYLSHMLIVMSYPAKMNLLIEPSYLVFLYIFLSNLFLSYLLGITLTLVYESPMLHLQKMIVKNMSNKFNDDNNSSCSPSSGKAENVHHAKIDVVRVSLYAQPQATSEPC